MAKIVTISVLVGKSPLILKLRKRYGPISTAGIKRVSPSESRLLDQLRIGNEYWAEEGGRKYRVKITRAAIALTSNSGDATVELFEVKRERKPKPTVRLRRKKNKD